MSNPNNSEPFETPATPKRPSPLQPRDAALDPFGVYSSDQPEPAPVDPPETVASDTDSADTSVEEGPYPFLRLEPIPVAPGAQGGGSGAETNQYLSAVPVPQLGAPGQTPQYQPMEARKAVRSTRRRSRGKFLAIGVIVVALAGTGGVLAINDVNKSNHGPDVVVGQYLDALAKGDIESAMKIGGLKAAEGTSGALLTNEVYEKVTNRPTDVKIANTEIAGDTATVTVSFKLGKAKDLVTQSLQVKKAGKESLVFDIWKIEPSTLPNLTATVPHAEGVLQVVGVDVTEFAEVDAEADTLTLSLPALPGTYEFAYTDPSGVYRPADGIVTMTSAPSTRQPAIVLETGLGDEVIAKVRDQVQASVNAWTDECVASEMLGETCSRAAKSVGDQVVSQNRHVVRFEVQAYPQVTVAFTKATGWTYATSGGMVAFVGLHEETRAEHPVPAAIGFTGGITVGEDHAVTEVAR